MNWYHKLLTSNTLFDSDLENSRKMIGNFDMVRGCNILSNAVSYVLPDRYIHPWLLSPCRDHIIEEQLNSSATAERHHLCHCIFMKNVLNKVGCPAMLYP